MSKNKLKSMLEEISYRASQLETEIEGCINEEDDIEDRYNEKVKQYGVFDDRNAIDELKFELVQRLYKNLSLEELEKLEATVNQRTGYINF